MVLLLNYAHVFVMLGMAFSAYLAFKDKIKWTTFGTVSIILLMSLVGLRAAGPSYLPKPDNPRLEAPAFEPSTSKIEDISLKPMDPKLREEQFKEKFDWQQQLGASNPQK